MAEKIIVPNLETKATDGNPVFTPRQWLDRFKQFTKREHKIDITPLPKKLRHNRFRSGGKRTSNTRRFYLGSGTGSTFPDNPSRIQNRPKAA